mmetsp:Transcript_114956/g.371649  ORF Transcript_114956/g.371649 Transcript_114956/m.371649 type:complete len:202 (-) Transcript_114956:405-1010(-)
MRCGGLPCGPLRRVRCRPLCVPSLLAGCVTLGIAMRVMVQQRVYYGLLKAGGLLDFQNVEGWRDPLLLVLVFSMVHAIGHFTLKLHALVLSGVAVHEELQQVAINFIAPYVVFMAFLYGSNDIEKMLVLLNKFVEEDPEHARKALASMVHLDEEGAREHGALGRGCCPHGRPEPRRRWRCARRCPQHRGRVSGGHPGLPGG